MRLRGAAPNTQAIGARIVANIAGEDQLREVTLGSNFASHNPTDQLFGLGSMAQVDTLTVEWPDGERTVMQAVAANGGTGHRSSATMIRRRRRYLLVAALLAGCGGLGRRRYRLRWRNQRSSVRDPATAGTVRRPAVERPVAGGDSQRLRTPDGACPQPVSHLCSDVRRLGGLLGKRQPPTLLGGQVGEFSCDLEDFTRPGDPRAARPGSHELQRLPIDRSSICRVAGGGRYQAVRPTC